MVQIKSDSPLVTIVQGEDAHTGRVVFTGSGRDEYNFSVTQSSGKLTVEVERKKKWSLNPFIDYDAQLHISLPQSWQKGTLDASVVSGFLHIDSTLALSRAELSSVSGAIQFGTIGLTQNISITSVSGSIEGQLLTAEDATIESVSGSIDIGTIELSENGFLRIQNVSGRVELPKMNTHNARITTVSG